MLRGLLALALALLAAGCAGGESAPAPSAPAPTEAAKAPLAATWTAPRYATLVQVRDGDTGRPVRRARVVLGRESVRTGRAGVAAFPFRQGRTRVRVEARGYTSHAERVAIAGPARIDVAVYRRDLQWPIYGATPGRTNAHPAIRLRPPFRVVWRRNLRTLLEFPAVVWNGVAYANNLRGWVMAVSMEDGRILWRRKLGARMASSPAVVPERGELVITTMIPGAVHVLGMKAGAERYRIRVGRTEGSPVVRKGLAYFSAENGRIYALDLERRRMRWSYATGAKATGSPALVGNRVYAGNYAGRVVALDARRGRLVWSTSVGTRVYNSIAAADGRLFVPSVFSGLVALSSRSGRRLWRVPLAENHGAPAYYRGRVYMGDASGTVYAVDARRGRVLWRRGAGERVASAIVVVAGVVYAGSLGNRITAWHWRSGRRLWSFPMSEYVPVSGNGGRLLMHGFSWLTAVEPRRKR